LQHGDKILKGEKMRETSNHGAAYVSDISETKMHLAMGHVLQIYKKNGWI
jgi:hypothetical protein